MMGNMLFSKKNPASNAINPEVAERRINAGKSRMSRVRAWFHRNDEAVSSPAGTSSCLSPEQITAILDAEANVRERAKSGKISRVCVGTGYNLVDVPWASRHPFVATMFELLGPSNGWQDQTVTVPVEEKIKNFKKAAKQDPGVQIPEMKKERTIDTFKIKHCIINGIEILEKIKTVPGDFIPVVIANGKDVNIDGKTYIRSAVEKAEDPQKMGNYWRSHLAEIIKIQPKAPYIGTAKQVAGYEKLYLEANETNLSYLPYNVDPDTPQTKPTREIPGAPPNALFQQLAVCDEDIRAAIGMHRAGVGQIDKVYSGAALGAMAKPGDIVAFGYIDNLRRNVLYTGKIINSMMADVIDTARDLRQRQSDETASFEPVNTTLGEAISKFREDPQRYNIDADKKRKLVKMMNDPKYGPSHPYNDLKKGTYEVYMTVGPQYSTQRQESAARLLELARHWPKLLDIGGDILLGMQDLLGCEELAARVKRVIPPNIAPPKEGEAPRQSPPPTPKVMLERQKFMTEKIKTLHEQIKMEKDLKEGQQDVAKQIKMVVLQMLQDIFAEEHPADQTLMPQQGSMPPQQ